MKTRWKTLIVVAVLLVGLFSLWLMTLRLQPEHELNSYLTLRRAQGEPLEVEKLVPPRPPPASNGYALLKPVLLRLAADEDVWTNLPIRWQMAAPAKAIVLAQQREIRGHGFTNTWENAGAILDSYPAELDLLKQATTFPALDFEVDYLNLYVRLTHLSALISGGKLLSGAAIYHLHLGQTAAAFTNVATLLTLIRSQHDERLIGSQSVRVSIAATAVNTTWEFLQSTQATEAQLAAVQQNWERISFFRECENAFMFFRAHLLKENEDVRADPRKFGLYARPRSGGGGNWWEEARDGVMADMDAVYFHQQFFMWQSLWGYKEEMAMLEGMDIAIAGLRSAQTNQPLGDLHSMMVREYAAVVRRVPAREYINRLLRYRIGNAHDSLPWFADLFQRIVEAETARRLLIAAIALKRFQLQHGNYPEQLAELVPDFLATVPLDPMDAKPLRYRPNADGAFVLYSVGPDRHDDHGDPSAPAGIGKTSFPWLHAKARDWVWPQPASDDEINYFFDNPP